MAWSNPVHVHGGYFGPEKNCPLCKREGKNSRGNRRAKGNRDDPGASGGTIDTTFGSPYRTTHTYPVSGGVLSHPIFQYLPTEADKPKVALPEREDDMPIMAWKWARLCWQDGFAFAGLGDGKGHRYKGRAEAACYRQSDMGWVTYSVTPSGGLQRGAINTAHEAPDPDCRCGFYGLASPPKPEDTKGYANNGPVLALLDVEFCGRVVVHELGYRAQKQRVLSAHLPEKCEFCAQPPEAAVIRNGYGDHAASRDVALRCSTHVGPFDVPVTFDALARELDCPVVVG